MSTSQLDSANDNGTLERLYSTGRRVATSTRHQFTLLLNNMGCIQAAAETPVASPQQDPQANPSDVQVNHSDKPEVMPGTQPGPNPETQPGPDHEHLEDAPRKGWSREAFREKSEASLQQPSQADPPDAQVKPPDVPKVTPGVQPGSDPERPEDPPPPVADRDAGPAARTTSGVDRGAIPGTREEEQPLLEEQVTEEEVAGRNTELIRNLPRDDWIRRVKESEAAEWISETLKDHAKEDQIESLKNEMFELAYIAMGDETLPEDLRRCLVVKTDRYARYAVCCLNCCTFGLFNIFRPRDDEMVLVLTKKERVLMYKIDRHNFFGKFLDTLQTVFTYALMFAGLLGSQYLMVLAVNHDWGTEELNEAAAFGKEVEKTVGENLWVQIVIYVACGFGLIFWIWTKCPHDYGNRHRQSHAAERVCVGQYSLSGGAWRRKATLRLHFGRYPDQKQLNHNMRLAGPAAVGPIDREALSEVGGNLNPLSGRSTGALLIVAIILLNVFTLLDAGLTYVYPPIHAFQQGEEAEEFCRTAGESDCNQVECERWTLNNKLPKAFCSEIKFKADEDGQEKRCTGCRHALVKRVFTDKTEMLKLLVGFFTDVGTLMFGFAAARQALRVDLDKGYIDITWGKKPFPRFYISDFLLTQPLGMAFMTSVFQSAFDEEETAARFNNNNSNNTPKVRRMHRVDDLGGGAADSANFQDITNFEESSNADYQNWEDFFNGLQLTEEGGVTRDLPKKTVVEKGEDKWKPKVNVPKRILGFVNGEAIIGAWSEQPQITLLMVSPILLCSFLIWILLLSAVDRHDEVGKAMAGIYGESIFQKVSADTTMCIIIFVLGLLSLYVYYFVAQKHAVILTDRRIFYVRYTDRCKTCCMFQPQVRVDIFRHDKALTYGSMMTNPPSLYMRFAQVPWTPGRVRIQPGFYGVLQLNRQRGNVLNIFQACCQLVEAKETVISESSIRDAGVSWDVCADYVQRNMQPSKLHSSLGDVWEITHMHADDLQGQIPEVFLAHNKEKPLFYWSFKEFGWLSQATSTNTDVVVTTNRLFKYSRANFKPYDCRTALCFGACYCTFFKSIINGPKYLQRTASFLMLPMMLSFNTDVSVQPPVWYDPMRMPVKVPCWETCCAWLTLCFVCQVCGEDGCNPTDIDCNKDTCSPVPVRGGARAQLWMMWRHRFNGLQTDLTCKIRPFLLKDQAFIADLCEALGLGAQKLDFDDSVPDQQDYRKVDMLRKIMGVVQDTVRMT